MLSVKERVSKNSPHYVGDADALFFQNLDNFCGFYQITFSLISSADYFFKHPKILFQSVQSNIKSTHQVSYDVMVAFYMFPHADSLGKETDKRENVFLQCMTKLDKSSRQSIELTLRFKCK